MAENILHFGAFRFRASGNKNMKLTLRSLDDSVSQTLLPLALTTSPGREPARLCNMLAQRASLRIYSDEMQAHVKINRIVIFVKPTYTSYPM